MFWKGSKAIMIYMDNIQEAKVKAKLLETQANEISASFQDIIQNLEQDLSLYSPNSKKTNFEIVLFKKKILMQVIKIFNEFLCIENIFMYD